MPQLIPVLIFLAKAAALAALSTGIGYGIRALTPQPRRPRAPSHNIEALRQTQRTNVAPSRVVYGTARISGVLAYAEAVNEKGERVEDGKIFHFCLALCEGPVYSIDDIELGDQPATSTQYGDRVLFVPFIGTRDQEPIAAALTVGGGPVTIPKVWADGAHALRGVAYLWGVLRWDAAAFPAGPPNTRCTIRGKMVYDPRNAACDEDDESTWVWTQNPALCVLDYLMSTRYGLGVSPADIDLGSFKAAADVCDELVAVEIAGNDPDTGKPYEIPPGTVDPQPRYTCNGVFETSGKRGDILDSLLQSMAGALYIRGGKWWLQAGVTRASTFHLTPDDLAGDLEVIPGASRTERTNEVRGTYVNREKNWLPDDFVVQSSDALVEADGGELHPLDLDLPYCADWYEASRMAQIHLKRARRGATFRWPAKLTAFGIERGDVGTITVDYLGLTNHAVICQEWEYRGDDGVVLTLQTYDATEYDYDPQPLPARPPASSLPGPWSVALPPVVVVTALQIELEGGTISAGFRVTITPAEGDLVAVDVYRIRYRHHDDATWQTRDTTSATFDALGLRGGDYRVEVAAVNRIGLVSPYTVKFVTVSHLGELPPDVGWIDAVWASPGGWRFAWLPAGRETSRLRGYELRFVVGHHSDGLARWANARPLGTSLGTTHTFETARMAQPSQRYTVYIRAVDVAGTYSASIAHTFIRAPRPVASERLLVDIDCKDAGWPGYFEPYGGRLTSANTIEGTSSLTGATAPATWAAWDTWASGARPVTYLHEIIDLGRDASVNPTIWALTSAGTTDGLNEDDDGVQVLMRAVSEEAGPPAGNDPAFGEFVQLAPVTARYFEFAITVSPTATAPVPEIREFRLQLTSYLLTEQQNDIHLGYQTDPQAIRRRENTRWALGQGVHRNTRFSRQFGTWYLTCGDPALQLTAASSHYLSLPNVSLLRLTTNWTLELWVAAAAQDGKFLLSKNGATDYALKWTSTTQLSFLGTGVPAGAVFNWGANSWGWRHVAVAHDGHFLSGYLDGVQQFRLPMSAALATSSGALFIGCHSGGSDYCTATVREVRLWSYGRTEADVRGNMSLQLDGTYTTRLSGYWRCDEGVDTIASDSTPQANHATTNAAWVYAASRVWPDFDLGAVRWLESLRVSWEEILADHGSIAVDWSPDAVTWEPVTNGGELKGLAIEYPAGGDLAGKRLYLRAWLLSTDTSENPPLLGEVVTEVTNKPPRGDNGAATLGDFTVVPTRSFATMEGAAVTAIQDAATVLSWVVVSRSPYAVRVKMFDPSTPTGAFTSPIRVDVLLQGGAQPAV